MIFKMRPSEIASWPAWETDLLEQFMALEPPAEARVEIVTARMCELMVRAWGGGKQQISVNDFLPYLNAWALEEIKLDSRYSDVDREVLGAFIKG